MRNSAAELVASPKRNGRQTKRKIQNDEYSRARRFISLRIHLLLFAGQDHICTCRPRGSWKSSRVTECSAGWDRVKRSVNWPFFTTVREQHPSKVPFNIILSSSILLFYLSCLFCFFLVEGRFLYFIFFSFYCRSRVNCVAGGTALVREQLLWWCAVVVVRPLGCYWQDDHVSKILLGRANTWLKETDRIMTPSAGEGNLFLPDPSPLVINGTPVRDEQNDRAIAREREREREEK